MSATASLMETVGASVLSSGGLWGVLQAILSRRERKIRLRKAVTDAQQGELDREQKEKDRSDLLAESQSTAQRTALESADIRYKNLEIDYTACRTGLNEIRDAAGILIDLFDNVMMKMRPGRPPGATTFTVTLQADEVIEIRRSISEARRHLLYFDWKVPPKNA
jgi:hypothetical protein